MIKSIFDISELLLKKSLPFAIYCLPGSKVFKLVFQKEQVCHKVDILDIEDVSGFVIADFNSARTGTTEIIKPDFEIFEGDNTDEAFEFINNLSDNDGNGFEENIYVSKSNYLDTAQYLITKLKDNELQKVVLSRVIQKKLKKNLDTTKLLKQLAEKYENAFVYLFHIPEEGTWCGASPEILYKAVGDFVNIDALAGTRLITENNGNANWSLKEKEEQYYVTLFIESLLSELGIDVYEESDPTTVTAGSLAHICTKFNIPISSVKSKIGKLIAGLHPTPAVCGLPKADAFFLIQKAEQHQRRYYTGFLGPWNMKEESHLFVNLRCAELGSDKINIYVGGGLTASSNPEAEYEETVHKSQTLLSIVENL
ncbi:MAG: chorismate-binding protein [Bacteroidota bacterium]